MATLFEEVANSLEMAGFTKMLNKDTRDGAIEALSTYAGFYHLLGPMSKFKEGL